MIDQMIEQLYRDWDNITELYLTDCIDDNDLFLFIENSRIIFSVCFPIELLLKCKIFLNTEDDEI